MHTHANWNFGLCQESAHTQTHTFINPYIHTYYYPYEIIVKVEHYRTTEVKM